jgi:hypothetical protein
MKVAICNPTDVQTAINNAAVGDISSATIFQSPK